MHQELPTLYFHIGQPKTGSSAIQAFLNHNRELLAQKAGLLYPNLEGTDYTKGNSFNHAAYFEKIKTQHKEQECLQDFSRCIKYCLHSNIRKIIISNEGFFWIWWPALIKSIKETLEVKIKIVLYLRRQDYYIESGWKQWGHKDPAYASITDYIEKNVFDWLLHLKPWLETFETDEFMVFPFERQSIGEDVVTHFMKIFAVNDISLYSQPQKSSVTTNFGFSPEIIEMMRLCDWNQKNINDHSLMNFLAESLPKKYIKTDPFAPYGILTPQKRHDIVNRYLQSNRQLEYIFHQTPDKSFFSEPIPDLNDTWMDKTGLTIEIITPIMLGLLFKQHLEIQNLKKTLRQSIVVRNVLTGPQSDEMIFHRQIDQVVRHKESVEFFANGNDPVILLPRSRVKEKRLLISVTMTAPVDSTAQIFFKKRYFQKFQESRSVRQKVKAGLNTLLFNLSNHQISGRLRFDPGCHPGKYIIHRIEISHST